MNNVGSNAVQVHGYFEKPLVVLDLVLVGNLVGIKVSVRARRK